MMPTGPPESTTRSESRPDISTRTPRWASPSTWSSGISQSRKTISAVGDPRMPSLSIFGETLKPAMSRSITNAVTDGDASSSGVVRM